MKLIPKISEHKIFQKKPIVLMHIGSAGSNFKGWLNIANKSILVSMIFSLFVFIIILFTFSENFLLIFCISINISTIIYLFLIVLKIRKIGIKFN